MKIISVWNNKGGVGKSTTTLMFAQILASKDKKVLVVDLDPQANITMILDKNDEVGEESKTSYDLLMDKEQDIKECIFKYKGENFEVDYIPSHPKLLLANNEIMLESMKRNANNRLKEGLEKLSTDEYDFVFIDSSPTIDLLTTNLLVASQEVIVPIKADKYSIAGINILNKTIKDIKEELNPDLKFGSVFLNMYQHSKVDDKVYNYLREQISFMAKNKINNAVAIKENTLENKLFLEIKHSNKKVIPQFEELMKEIGLF